MLSGSKRLNTKLFKEIILKGKYIHNDLFVLRTMSFTGPSRFSVSVPHKIAKNAVLRNKVRRRVYSAIKNIYPEVKENFYSVFIMKASSIKSNIDIISNEIKTSLGKMGILK